jgi:hypothetical protein
MEFAKDLLASLHDRLGTGGNAVAAPHCDWQALSARLQAAHAARIALYEAEAQSLRPLGGSFGTGSAAAYLAAGHDSRPVNRTDLADGKAPGSNAVAAAAQSADVGRG